MTNYEWIELLASQHIIRIIIPLLVLLKINNFAINLKADSYYKIIINIL